MRERCAGEMAIPRERKIFMGLFSKKVKEEPKTIMFTGKNEDLFTRISLDSVSKEDRIIVPATHSAIIMSNGKLTSTLDGGEYYIDPNGLHKDARVDVLFLSKTVRIQCLFGTPSPVVIKDPSTDLVVEAGVRGEFNVNIENPRQAYLELIGVEDNFNLDSLKKRLSILMVARIGTVLAEVTYNENISYDMYDFNKAKIEKLIMATLEEEFRTKFGVKLFDLIVEKIFMSPENQQKIEAKRKELKEAEAAKGNKAFCTSCGAQIAPNSKFCPECGKPVQQFGNVCPVCGVSNDPESKFCKNCGKQLK